MDEKEREKLKEEIRQCQREIMRDVFSGDLSTEMFLLACRSYVEFELRLNPGEYHV